MKLEVCIDSYESMISAAVAGANRVEICSALDLDGLTPSIGLVRMCESYDIEKYVMIRPRPGHFTYDGLEIAQMKEEIMAFKDMKIHGFVFGVLDADGRIDIETMKELVYLAYPKSVAFHRAFDYSIGGEDQVEDLIKMGIERILTSGKKPKAIDGLDLIRDLQEKYGDKIEIMAGSGINSSNIKEIYEKTGIESFHMSARDYYQTEIDYDNFGGAFSDYSYAVGIEIEMAREVLDSL